MKTKRYNTPGTYRCPKCKQTVKLLIASHALCLRCSNVMRRVLLPPKCAE